uniref:Uncharacterized protein n=1 Tax=Utricularia reniformis TaxID=192314 RepID=A0A1Y0B178_9LAMI|nr:hypothetical protein AEK19_MT0981 [Utricularia reniformis]ART31205.1 hypothetical protein AEK19_MT0981 [Utricularia reniformis]
MDLSSFALRVIPKKIFSHSKDLSGLIPDVNLKKACIRVIDKTSWLTGPSSLWISLIK